MHDPGRIVLLVNLFSDVSRFLRRLRLLRANDHTGGKDSKQASRDAGTRPIVRDYDFLLVGHCTRIPLVGWSCSKHRRELPRLASGGPTGANCRSLVLENLPDQHPEPLSFSDHKFDENFITGKPPLGGAGSNVVRMIRLPGIGNGTH
jgi:hypothetical protein